MLRLSLQSRSPGSARGSRLPSSAELPNRITDATSASRIDTKLGHLTAERDQAVLAGVPNKPSAGAAHGQSLRRGSRPHGPGRLSPRGSHQPTRYDRPHRPASQLARCRSGVGDRGLERVCAAGAEARLLARLHSRDLEARSRPSPAPAAWKDHPVAERWPGGRKDSGWG